MSSLKSILQRMGADSVDRMIKKPIQPETPKQLAEVLQKIGIKRWSPVVGKYFDPDMPEKLRDFVDGEVTLLYLLSELDKRLPKKKSKREVDFSEIIKRIDEISDTAVFEDIAGPVLAREDEKALLGIIKKAGVEKLVSFLVGFSEEISKGPEFKGKDSLKTFIRGALSTLYYLVNLSNNIQLEKHFRLRGE